MMWVRDETKKISAIYKMSTVISDKEEKMQRK